MKTERTFKNKTVGSDGSVYICMRTKPETGESNFIVKVVHLNSATTVFWMNQKGHPLKPASDKIWKNCLKTWEPKVPVEKLPSRLIREAEAIVKKIHYAMAHQLPVGDYVFKKHIHRVKFKQKDKHLKKEIEESLRRLDDAPKKPKVVKKTKSKSVGYSYVSFEDIAHAPLSSRTRTA